MTPFPQTLAIIIGKKGLFMPENNFAAKTITVFPPKEREGPAFSENLHYNYQMKQIYFYIKKGELIGNNGRGNRARGFC